MNKTRLDLENILSINDWTDIVDTKAEMIETVFTGDADELLSELNTAE